MLIINDCHLGVNRQAGTTPATQGALRGYIRASYQVLLNETTEGHVVVNGDLFDSFTVDIAEVVCTFEMFADWLHASPTRRLSLCMGNHDSNPRGDKMSSFHFLCKFLCFQFMTQVKVFDGGLEHVSDNVWCIPHQANQAIFDLEIANAVKDPTPGAYLLLHCNYKNTFAEHSDHSLNISADQVNALIVAGWNLVLGHEHQGYTLRGERVIVVGNQFPTSVSDCIGETYKRALIIKGDGHEFHGTWVPEGNYAEVPWQEAATYAGQENFIRIVGECTAEESADMIAAAAKLRQTSDAYVVSNAVKVAGMVEMEALTSMTTENISKFNVMDALLETLDEGEQVKVKALMA